jgi:hypothetical protein
MDGPTRRVYKPRLDCIKEVVMRHILTVIWTGMMIGVLTAAWGDDTPGTAPAEGTFGYDLAFLQKHTDAFALGEGDAQIIVAPAYQGRVMTSTIGGAGGPSFGWLNYKVIAAGILPPEARKDRLEDHIFVFGGEERFWLGPEGGQFGLYFPPGAPFDFAHWHTPAAIDTDPYTVVRKTNRMAEFHKDATLINYTGTTFKVGIDRVIRVLDAAETGKAFGIPLTPEIKSVAYETDNRIANAGDQPWTRQTGLLSIWLLGMYRPTASTTIVIPFRDPPELRGEPKVNDAYFGKVPSDYLIVKDSVLFFRGDGTRRGKIGIGPARSLGVAGSYDAAGKVLTLVTYTVPESHEGYVNSMWEIQKQPYAGDALNAYNDGSPEPGKPPMGPFYELETSSPAAALKPGASIRHVQRTVHLTGPQSALDAIARAKLGVGLADIESAFKK